MCLKPRDSLSAETGETPGGKRLREGGTRQCFGALLASCLAMLNAGLAWQERRDNSFVGTDVFQFSPANCGLCLKGKMSMNSLFGRV